MKLLKTPPPRWDARIAYPLQSVGYAQAAAALGHRPLFAEDEGGIALVLVRRVPVPIVGAWTARAKVYAHADDPAFLPTLVGRLRRFGVSHIRFGDSIWGVSGSLPEHWPAFRRTVHHVIVNDVRFGDDELLARIKGKVRRHIRVAAKVNVSAVRTAADLRDYLELSEQTAQRMRGLDLAAVYPRAYFEAIVDEMVPHGQAALFIARAGDIPLAGGLFVASRERFVYVHGCSTRDRELTRLQGPSALFWHAVRFARDRGCAMFEMGAVTPTDDPTHPHYSVYEYKKGWGGTVEPVRTGEVVVSPLKYRFQEYVLAPMWDRVHPLYLRLFGAERDRPRLSPGPCVPEEAAELPMVSR